MKRMSKVEEIVVHAGQFHMDDVMCVAMMQCLNPEIKVSRVFSVTDEMEADENIIICDIGGGEYDHHQADAKLRSDGRKRAACGLLFEAIKEELFPNMETAECFERDFIIPIEDTDNGVSKDTLSLAVYSLNPTWNGHESSDEAFEKAVVMVKAILEREIENAKATVEAEAIVKNALERMDDTTVILPEFAPWETVLVPSEAKFVIFPSNRGGFGLQVVPVEVGSFEAKKALPSSWLANAPEGCSFCHQGRFIAFFDTEEQAVNAAKKAEEALEEVF